MSFQDLDERLDVAELRARVDQQLNRLSATLFTMMSIAADDAARACGDSREQGGDAVLQQRIAFLGQFAAGLALIEADALPGKGAGYGSTVIGEELFTGRHHQYTLMLGSLVDIDGGQVSLASPIGQALFGREIGDVVQVTLPHRRIHLRIVSVKTIHELLAELELNLADLEALERT